MSAAAQLEQVGHGFDPETEAARLEGRIDPTKVEQLSPLWFALRIGRETGSRIGKILGLPGAFGDPESVMRDMVRERHGLPSDFVGSAATRYGTENEPLARRHAEQEMEDAIAECGIFIHPEHNWLAESPDGIVLTSGRPVQIKCPYKLRNISNPTFKKAADLPAYWAQMQLSCEVTGADACEFVQWNPYAISIETVPRDQKWFQSVRPQLEAFYERFLQIIADPKLSAPYLKDLSVERDDYVWLEAAAAYKAAKEAEDAAAAATAEAKAQLLELVEHRTTRGGGVLVKQYEKKGSINWSKVQKEHGAAFAAIDLEAYRGKKVEQTTVTVEKPKAG